jgi:hypothetical protein
VKRDEIDRIVGRDLFIGEHDGRLYATDRFWMAPAEASVADLLRYWNLPVEAGLSAERADEEDGEDGRWFRNTVPSPGIDTVVRLRPTSEARLVTDAHTGLPLFVETLFGDALAMFDTTGGRCYIRLDYLRLCAGPQWHERAWKCDKPTGPLRHDGDDGMVVIMPVRMP